LFQRRSVHERATYPVRVFIYVRLDIRSCHRSTRAPAFRGGTPSQYMNTSNAPNYCHCKRCRNTYCGSD
jgi:hypothetical protein